MKISDTKNFTLPSMYTECNSKQHNLKSVKCEHILIFLFLLGLVSIMIQNFSTQQQNKNFDTLLNVSVFNRQMLE